MSSEVKVSNKAKNVLGSSLEICGCDPKTGFFRDNFCHTDIRDQGMHTVCCLVTDDFLEYSKNAGNDLSTPRPEYGFQGLKAGDRWCVCAGRWLQAYKDGKACPVIINATHEETMAVIPLEFLQQMDHEKHGFS